MSAEPDPTIILVGEDTNGGFCVCESNGTVAGAFASRAEAVRFAEHESRAHPGSIVMDTPLVVHAAPRLAA